MDIISAYKQSNNSKKPQNVVEEAKKSFSDVYKAPGERTGNQTVHIPNEFEPPPVMPSPFAQQTGQIQANTQANTHGYNTPPNVQSTEFVGDFFETVHNVTKQLKNLLKSFEMDDSDYDKISSSIMKLECVLEDSDYENDYEDDYQYEEEPEEVVGVIAIQQESKKSKWGDTSLYMS